MGKGFRVLAGGVCVVLRLSEWGGAASHAADSHRQHERLDGFQEGKARTCGEAAYNSRRWQRF